MMGKKERVFSPLPTDVSLEHLVPEDNRYRRLEAVLDLSFVRELVAPLYASGGRPSVDPVVFFKLQLVMFFEGIRSERELMRVAADRLSVRWYLGYDLHEPLPDLATGLGAWGPWINGGGWLRVEGRPVDWLYRDAGKVRAVVERCTRGETACHYQPGHPHGFHEHIYPGEVHHCRILHDPGHLLRELKAAVAVYPPKLKREVVRRYLWEAGFSLETLRKPAARGEASYVSGCLFRGVACMVQVLFAANGRWFLNEKGSVAAVESFPLRPRGFSEVASRLLGCPGLDAGTLAETVSSYEALLDGVRRSCGAEGG